MKLGCRLETACNKPNYDSNSAHAHEKIEGNNRKTNCCGNTHVDTNSLLRNGDWGLRVCVSLATVNDMTLQRHGRFALASSSSDSSDVDACHTTAQWEAVAQLPKQQTLHVIIPRFGESPIRIRTDSLQLRCCFLGTGLSYTNDNTHRLRHGLDGAGSEVRASL